jgi:hypothetical protein
MMENLEILATRSKCLNGKKRNPDSGKIGAIEHSSIFSIEEYIAPGEPPQFTQTTFLRCFACLGAKKTTGLLHDTQPIGGSFEEVKIYLYVERWV